jgi:hypothetical protein
MSGMEGRAGRWLARGRYLRRGPGSDAQALHRKPLMRAHPELGQGNGVIWSHRRTPMCPLSMNPGPKPSKAHSSTCSDNLPWLLQQPWHAFQHFIPKPSRCACGVSACVPSRPIPIHRPSNETPFKTTTLVHDGRVRHCEHPPKPKRGQSAAPGHQNLGTPGLRRMGCDA